MYPVGLSLALVTSLHVPRVRQSNPTPCWIDAGLAVPTHSRWRRSRVSWPCNFRRALDEAETMGRLSALCLRVMIPTGGASIRKSTGIGLKPRRFAFSEALTSRGSKVSARPLAEHEGGEGEGGGAYLAPHS